GTLEKFLSYKYSSDLAPRATPQPYLYANRGQTVSALLCQPQFVCQAKNFSNKGFSLYRHLYALIDTKLTPTRNKSRTFTNTPIVPLRVAKSLWSQARSGYTHTDLSGTILRAEFGC